MEWFYNNSHLFIRVPSSPERRILNDTPVLLVNTLNSHVFESTVQYFETDLSESPIFYDLLSTPAFMQDFRDRIAIHDIHCIREPNPTPTLPPLPSLQEVCPDCGSILESPIEIEDMRHVNTTKKVCNDCFGNYRECNYCYELVPISSTKTFRSLQGTERRVFCLDCLSTPTFSISTFKCDYCGYAFIGSPQGTFQGKKFCPQCNPLPRECDICHNLFEKRKTSVEANTSVIYCSSCYTKVAKGRRWTARDAKANPIFHAALAEKVLVKPKFLGMELEIDATSGPGYAGVLPFLEYLRNLSGHNKDFLMKGDGSLSFGGIELVFDPRTILSWQEYKPHLEEILKTAKETHSLRSHDTKTCGLHIHVSRAFFNTNEQIANLLFLHERYWDNIVAFSRKSSSQINQYAKRYGFSDSPADIYNKTVQAGRYFAINLSNRNTIEFRVFRGSLNITTVMAALQFTSNLCEIAKETDPLSIRDILWGSIIQKNSYPELISYASSYILSDSDV